MGQWDDVECPGCGHRDSFWLEANARVLIADDGEWLAEEVDEVRDNEWLRCGDCGFGDERGVFEEARKNSDEEEEEEPEEEKAPSMLI